MDISRTMRMHVLAVCGMIMLVGCATGMRFYSSEPLPQKEVSLIYTILSLDSITREGQQKMDIVGDHGSTSELLPGNYVLELRYVHQGVNNNYSIGLTVPCPLQASAGHVYYIYPKIQTPGTWSPAVIDIVSEEDYRKITYQNPEEVKKWINKYLTGSRKSAQKEEISTSKGVLIIWR